METPNILPKIECKHRESRSFSTGSIGNGRPTNVLTRRNRKSWSQMDFDCYEKELKQQIAALQAINPQSITGDVYIIYNYVSTLESRKLTILNNIQ